MLLALDFDRTFTADPALWSNFLRTATNRDHQVIMVTCRTDRVANREFIQRALLRTGALNRILKVVYTGHQPKRAAAEAAGFKVDVWIDDAPETVGAQDSAEVAAIEEQFHLRGE